MSGVLRENDAIEKEYERWLENTSGRLREELKNLTPQAKRESFALELEFGTGGMRGLMGPGTNRLNELTIARVSMGFAHWIGESCENPSLVVAYDTRHNSSDFAEVAANVFSSQGIEVHLFGEPTATPILSYAVRKLRASGGVVITASHNPSPYNGYKVYTSDGTQAIPKFASEIVEEIDKFDYFQEYSPREELVKVVPADLTRSFIDTVVGAVKDLCPEYDKLKLVYTPLHGTGNYPVYKALAELGHTLFRVEEQAVPDGDFPTVDYPNPEDEGAYELALEIAREKGAELVIATDPDCDRLGAMARYGEEYVFFSGNQIGAMLTDFILENLQGRFPPDPYIVKTIVSSDLAGKIAESYGVRVEETLTGFKYIGRLIEESIEKGSGNFIFGFEESYGYLYGTHARDKDAVMAAALVGAMAGSLKKKGFTLPEYLERLYQKHGYFLEALIDKEYAGLEGKRKIEGIMAGLREDKPKKLNGKKLVEFLDYERDPGELPKSNVVSLKFQGGCKLIVRPSGTEPKIKFYLFASDRDELEAKKTLGELEDMVERIVNS